MKKIKLFSYSLPDQRAALRMFCYLGKKNLPTWSAQRFDVIDRVRNVGFIARSNIRPVLAHSPLTS